MTTTHPTSQLANASHNKRRIAFSVLGAIVVVLLVIKPPFVLRPIPGKGVNKDAQPDSVSSAFTGSFWTDKVLPKILTDSRDASTLIPELRANPSEAGSKYGVREGNNPFNYLIKGSGKVLEVNTTSRAGSMTLQLTGGEKVILQIGPVVMGTALRDANGLVRFNQFTNQLDYAAVSKDMNALAIKAALQGKSPDSFAGKTVSFWGACTFQPKTTDPVKITPVKLEVQE